MSSMALSQSSMRMYMVVALGLSDVRSSTRSFLWFCRTIFILSSSVCIGVGAGKFDGEQCAPENTYSGGFEHDYQADCRSGDGKPYFQGSEQFLGAF